MQDPAGLQAVTTMSPYPYQQLRCPRCESSNTKFCYYNNYNLAQPRHFCKNCRRYWTQGGVLRNVPVGGGTRKSSKRSAAPTTTPNPKRLSSSTTVSSTAPVSSMAPPANQHYPENFLGLEGGSRRWVGGQPYLSIYAPGSGFQ